MKARKRHDDVMYQKVGYPSKDGELYIRRSGFGEVGICEVNENSNEIKKCIWFDDITNAKKALKDVDFYLMRM